MAPIALATKTVVLGLRAITINANPKLAIRRYFAVRCRCWRVAANLDAVDVTLHFIWRLPATLAHKSQGTLGQAGSNSRILSARRDFSSAFQPWDVQPGFCNRQKYIQGMNARKVPRNGVTGQSVCRELFAFENTMRNSNPRVRKSCRSGSQIPSIG